MATFKQKRWNKCRQNGYDINHQRSKLLLIYNCFDSTTSLAKYVTLQPCHGDVETSQTHTHHSAIKYTHLMQTLPLVQKPRAFVCWTQTPATHAQKMWMEHKKKGGKKVSFELICVTRLRSFWLAMMSIQIVTQVVAVAEG